MQQEIPNRPPPLYLVALLLVVVFGVYAPSLGNGFALDDPIVAKAVLPNGNPNGMTATLRPLAEYFTSGYWIGHDGELSPLFRPVTVLSYAVTNALQGGVHADPEWEAFPHHLINVLLHVLATWLVYVLMRRVIPRWALLAAAVFGLHAIHSEVVAGIVGRAELFGFCFGALGLLAFTIGRGRRGVGRSVLFGVSAFALFLAFGSKENSVAWAAFLWVYAAVEDQVRGRPGTLWSTGLRVAGVAAVPLVAFLWLRGIALADVPSPFPIHRLANPLAHEPFDVRMLTAVAVWGMYGLGKCLLPWNLVSDYGPVTIDILSAAWDVRFLASAAVLLGGLMLAFWRFRRDPVLFLAVTCFLGFSFPITNVPLVIGTVFGERLYFTPSLGVAIGAAWAVGKFERPAVPLGLVGVWLVMGIVVILGRNGAWQNETTLTERDAVKNPRCLRLLEAHAGHLDRMNQKAAARATWERALILDPDFADALSSYGGFLARQGQYPAAEKLFLRALEADGDKRLRHITHYNLSLLYGQMQQKERSVEHVRTAWLEPGAYSLVHEPLLTRTHALLPPDEVESIVVEGERRAPDHPTWPLQRAYLALAREQPALGIELLRRALARRPRHPLTRWVLGATLLQEGRDAEARPILDGLRRDKSAPQELRQMARRALRGQ